MNRKYFLLLFFVGIVTSYGQYTSISDANFETALTELGYDDTPNDGQVPTALISTIEMLEMPGKNIANLEGIEDFAALRILNLSDNPIGNLDESVLNLLEELVIGKTSITNIDVSQMPLLKKLDIQDLLISSLDLSNNQQLEELIAANATLANISFGSLGVLRKLDLSNNAFISLDLSAFTVLEEINLESNNLSYLDLRNGNNDNLTSFSALYNDDLTCIYVDNANDFTTAWSGQLDLQSIPREVYCDYTSIADANFEAALDALGYDNISGDGLVPTALITGVTSLDIDNSNISDLKGIEAFVALDELVADNNNISSVDFSKNTALRRVFLRNNSISTLDLTSNTAISRLLVENNGMTSLDITGLSSLAQLYAGNNSLTEMDLSTNTSLKVVGLNVNNLSSLNLKNGNNGNITTIALGSNPNLTCVLVDNAGDSTNKWLSVDSQTSFSDTYCNYTEIPDLAFEEALYNLGYDDIIDDGQVPTALIESITSLDVSSQGIEYITGIEYFISLENLIANDNPFSFIDLSNLTQLTELQLQNTGISSIDVSNNAVLSILNLEENELTTVDISSNDLLTKLNLSKTNITSIDLTTNTLLEELVLTEIEELDAILFGNKDQLKLLNVSLNNLTTLDLSQLPALQEVYINDNALTEVNLKNGNNDLIVNFDARNNPNLECIFVDNVTSAEAKFTNIDATTGFGTADYCRYTTGLDANFEAALENLGYDDISGDRQVPTALIENVTSLDVASSAISSLTGIEAFAALTSLNAASNDIVNADFSNNLLLEEINLENNEVTDLNINGLSKLEILNCEENQIDNISLSTSTALKNLNLINNQLATIDVSNNINLEYLSAGGNSNLATIDLSNNTSLIAISMSGCNLESLDLSNHLNLTSINLATNELTFLNIKNGNNDDITTFNTTNNPSLTCILVDDADEAQIKFINIDSNNNFSDTYCRYTAIPDANFEAALENEGYDDITGDRKVPTALIENITELDLEREEIENISGIEDFISLTELNASFNEFTTIDLENLVALQRLDLRSNDITSLNLSTNIGLTNLDLEANSKLTSLDLSNNVLLEYIYAFQTGIENITFGSLSVLKTLDLYENSITNIDLSSLTNLEHLNISQNDITSIDVSNNLALQYLDLSYNSISHALDLSQHSNLTALNMYDCDLVELNVKNGNNDKLTSLSTTFNFNLACIVVDNATASVTENWSFENTTSLTETYCRYTTIPDANFEAALEALGYDNISNDGQVPTALIENITTLSISDNDIQKLTGIEGFSALTELVLYQVGLPTIDLSKNVLIETLNVSGNPLTEIALSDLANLTALYIDNTNITSLDLSANTALTKAEVTNNDNITTINFRNGTNGNLEEHDFRGNLNLTCILVDNVDEIASSWTNIDAITSFSETDYCNYTAIPDANFEAALENLGYDDISEDGQVPTALIENLTSLDVSDNDIDYLTGIADFTALIFLSVSENNLEDIDLSSNTKITALSLEENELTTVDLSALTDLYLLSLNDNNFTSLDLSSNTKIAILSLEKNQFTTVDLSGLPDLEIVSVSDNNLTSLDVSNNDEITSLIASSNLLNSVDISNLSNLVTFKCSDCGLTSVDITENTALEELSLSFNALTSLDLSAHTNLTLVELANNQLEHLDLRNGSNIRSQLFMRPTIQILAVFL